MSRYLRMMAPAGESWETFKLLPSGKVRVVRTEAWFNGPIEIAWTRVYSREDATNRWLWLRDKKGWRESKRWETKDNPKKVQSNPVRGEWWIDDSGHALYADGDVGDMGHEAYVVDKLTRIFLDALGIEEQGEFVGGLDNYVGEIKDLMKKKKATDYRMFVLAAAKSKFATTQQLVDAFDIARHSGRLDARMYAMQYDGWKRVQKNNIETWSLTSSDLNYIANGLDDAAGDDLQDDDTFNIYVFFTKMWYKDVPWSVINEGDAGKLRIYGTKDNPRRRR